jgi:hypothetical protein
LEGDQAGAFGVVEETVSNAVAPEPRTDLLRVELHVIETTEAWRIDRRSSGAPAESRSIRGSGAGRSGQDFAPLQARVDTPVRASVMYRADISA